MDHSQHMDNHQPLPDGDERLPPPDDIDPPPLEPKHQAAVLFFMFFADQASVKFSLGNAENKALLYCAHFYASTFAKMVYGVDIHPDSIREYHVKVDRIWDGHGLAEIIGSLVHDEETFEEVTSFVTEERGLMKDLSPTQKFWQQTIIDAVNLPQSPTSKEPSEYVKLSTGYLAIVKSEHREECRLPLPELRQSRDIDLKTSYFYDELETFERCFDPKSFWRARSGGMKK